MTNEKEKSMLSEEDGDLSALLKVDVYTLGAYTIDVPKRLLTIGGETKKLTNKELHLIILFAANINNMLDRKYALKTVWKDDNYFNARSMDVYICKIRKLLKADPNIIIINIHGKGYKMIAPTN